MPKPLADATKAHRLRRVTHTSVVTAGVAVLGGGSYALLLAVNRHASPNEVAAFGAFWGLSFGLIGGILLPFEQLMVRTTASRSMSKVSSGKDALAGKHVIRLYAVIAATLCAGLALASDRLAAWLLGGDEALAYILAAYVPVAVVQSWQRGVAAGCDRLDIYGRQLAIDGVARLVLGSVLLIAGEGRPMAAGIGVLAAGAVSLPFSRPPRQPAYLQPVSGLRHLVVEVLLLSVAGTVSMWVLNAGPVVVAWLDTPSRPAAAFAAVFVIARVPLLFQSSLQSVVVTSVARRHASHDLAGLRRAVSASLAVVTASGIGVVLLFGLLVNVWADLLYGPRFQVALLTGTGLALSTALFLVAAVSHASLVGLGASGQASLAWLVGGTVFAATVALAPVDDTPTRVVLAYVVSALLLLVVQAVGLVQRLRDRPGRGG